MVLGGSLTSHKLPGVTGCLSGTTVFCQAQPGHNHSDEAGQCHSSDIYQQGRGAHSLPLCQLVVTIWEWCIQRNIFLLAEHLPGKDNLAVDQELRLMKDCWNWMLNLQVFNQIQLQMGPLQIDLFASQFTKQLPTFYSWRVDPEAQGTDAFN